MSFPRFCNMRNVVDAYGGYVGAEVTLNAIDEICVLAFFHFPIGRQFFNITIPSYLNQASAHPLHNHCERNRENDPLNWALQERNILLNEFVQCRPVGATLPNNGFVNCTRVVQIVDAESLSLSFAYPMERLGQLLQADVSRLLDAPHFHARVLPIEDFQSFCRGLQESRVQGATSCTGAFFYFRHRLLAFADGIITDAESIVIPVSCL